MSDGMVFDNDMSNDTRPATIEARNARRGDIIGHPHTGEHVTVVRLFPVDATGLAALRYRATGGPVDVPGHAGKAHGATLYATVTVAPRGLLYHHGYDGTLPPAGADPR